MSEKRIGFLSLDEPFSAAVVEAVNERKVRGIKAEHISPEVISSESSSGCVLIVDRISHLLPFFRSYLRYEVLNGVCVVNNPFRDYSQDKFFACSLASELGLKTPKTLCLPPFEFPVGLSDIDLRHTATSINIDFILSSISFPAVLKPNCGFGGRNVSRIDAPQEFLKAYSGSKDEVMLLQEFIDYDRYVRCLVIGKEDVLLIKYDPRVPFGGRQYIAAEPAYLPGSLRSKIEDSCRAISGALDYDVNTVEFAIKDDIPYMIDCTNPVPDIDPYRIPADYFDWAVDKMSEMLFDFVLSAKKTER